MRSILFTLLMVSSAVAVELDRENIVQNEQPGYCGWTALESIANQHNFKPLKGLLQIRKNKRWQFENGRWVQYNSWLGYESSVKKQLTDLGVKYTHQSYGNKDTKILERANTEGVMIVLRAGWAGPRSVCHAVILSRFKDDDTHVWYYDTQDRNRYKASMQWFKDYWTGEVFALDMEEPNDAGSN